MAQVMVHCNSLTCGLALRSTERLMNHDARVGQRVALALETATDTSFLTHVDMSKRPLAVRRQYENYRNCDKGDN